MKKINVLAIAILFVCLTLLIPGSALLFGMETKQVPVKGKVTMVDLGAASCIPCKMMAPILEKLEKHYRGKAVVVFIDLRYDREAAQRFGVRAIPTQIFFDKNGKEVNRHIGFMSEEAIVAQLQSMGVK
ncbi:MAG: thioredoxin domain-containing protein [Deltaproteobacteria bacterium]|nr:thioredoxin domain-containing protein [Deltaproteobacteria bacterium]